MIIPRSLIDQLDEAKTLAETAGYEILRVWKTRYPNRVGRGLLAEISNKVVEDDPSTIIFYGDPSPSTVYLLMKNTRRRIIDRVELILEIFVKHAGSREALLQIEMARIKHEIPLVREFIRRSKMGELPGFLGPGGYAVDAYYRHLTSRLARLRRELERLRQIRSKQRGSRGRLGLLHAAIVGYASAGKTTLFNAITGLSKPVGPEYFTTLQPKHFRVRIAGADIVFVDTVGFIRDVPPTIIEAFHSTLEEITESDVIIFVVDASKGLRKIEYELESGFEILNNIGAVGIPIFIALNKIDLITEDETRELLNRVRGMLTSEPAVKGIIPISAKNRVNIDALVREVAKIGSSARALETIPESLRAEARP